MVSHLRTHYLEAYSLVKALPRYLDAQQALGAEPPFAVLLTLVGVRGFYMDAKKATSEYYNRNPRNVLDVAEVIVEEYNVTEQNAPAVLRPSSTLSGTPPATRARPTMTTTVLGRRRSSSRIEQRESKISAGKRDGHTHDPERADGDDDGQEGRHDRLCHRVRPDPPARPASSWRGATAALRPGILYGLRSEAPREEEVAEPVDTIHPDATAVHCPHYTEDIWRRLRTVSASVECIQVRSCWLVVVLATWGPPPYSLPPRWARVCWRPRAARMTTPGVGRAARARSSTMQTPSLRQRCERSRPTG